MTLPQGQFRVMLFDDDGVGVRGWLGDRDVEYGGVSGGWNTVDRPHARQLTNWSGAPARTMTFDFIFERGLAASSVEAMVERLENFAGGEYVSSPSAGVTEMRPPATVRVEGDGLRHVDLPYVVSDLSWGKATLNADGLLLRQRGSVTLLQQVTGPIFADPLRAQANIGRVHFRMIYTRQGENLMLVAKRVMGNAQLWKQLRRHNQQFRDPRKVLPTGTRLRVPLR